MISCPGDMRNLEIHAFTNLQTLLHLPLIDQGTTISEEKA